MNEFQKRNPTLRVFSAHLHMDEASISAEAVGKKVEKAKKELQEIAPLVNNVKSYASEYGRPVEELLPEAGKLESEKEKRKLLRKNQRDIR